MSMLKNQRFTVDALFNVAGWVCVVTGGGTGIGLMIAQALANSRARVYITGRRQDVLQQAVDSWGSPLSHMKGNVYSISQEEDHVGVLVNNAGITSQTTEVEKGDVNAKELSSELWELTVEDWLDVYRTNVMGHFFTATAFLPLLSAASNLRPDHTGNIINISSMSGITATSQYHIQYNVSKSASIQLTRLLAQEFKRPGVNVRVNSIAPGIFPSEMTMSGSDEQNKSTIPAGMDYGEKKGIPAGRPGKEEDIAQAALMLATDQYAYGQRHCFPVVTIDGGYLLVHG
ncbi:uncharacterized protein EV420DRAFT_1621946 [Desarmillaria tabescens]|uniref:NAD(P)-binding protein n=1 Tax=Armillaria tabescens TaxID=1929756 RepID=A0AA39JX99_ARMTA|nr:uncharacterized protein EV420DRAFT_1621946 [Desarmillaria tabescens]KAK0450312.1 hypothetical protein EV420DRAFT_1621946 [Desarmillaria tabescens]